MGYFSAVVLLLLSLSLATSDLNHDKFMQCMSRQLTDSYTEASKIIYTSNSSSYSNLFQSYLQNLRLVNPTTFKPVLIISPSSESEIQAAVLCSRRQNLQIRVRSGGHDYEGQSYLSRMPYIVVDLVNLRAVDVNVKDKTAWVQSGATLGELYYGIAKKSSVHAFPAGTCPTVGVGGHFSGGGLGTMQRKFGLAADNILDARIVDLNGKIFDRKAMGEDLFWAIRGGGAGSYGIITAWKIKLVQVPQIVTTFLVSRTQEQGATKLVNKWQNIADRLHEDLFVRVIIQNGVSGNKKTGQAMFQSLFLGGTQRLLSEMNKHFPELGLQGQNCNEMTWIQSVLYIAFHRKGDPLEILLNRDVSNKEYFKAKSDFVKVPIPENVLEGIWDRFRQEDKVLMILEPFGGRMSEIAESEIAFPHRKGNMYNIQYLIKWEESGVRESNLHVNWMKMLYRHMTPYVSNPRTAYVNYRDLDLGTNRLANISFKDAGFWGFKYFKENIRRLAIVKGKFDPVNFFRSEQSIPPLLQQARRTSKESVNKTTCIALD